MLTYCCATNWGGGGGGGGGRGVSLALIQDLKEGGCFQDLGAQLLSITFTTVHGLSQILAKQECNRSPSELIYCFLYTNRGVTVYGEVIVRITSQLSCTNEEQSVFTLATE